MHIQSIANVYWMLAIIILCMLIYSSAGNLIIAMNVKTRTYTFKYYWSMTTLTQIPCYNIPFIPENIGKILNNICTTQTTSKRPLLGVTSYGPGAISVKISVVRHFFVFFSTGHLPISWWTPCMEPSYPESTIAGSTALRFM